jgi:hypothetical protein
MYRNDNFKGDSVVKMRLQIGSTLDVGYFLHGIKINCSEDSI